MAELAENEMKANCAMPEWVGSNEGLGRRRDLSSQRPVAAFFGREDTGLRGLGLAALCAAREPDCFTCAKRRCLWWRRCVALEDAKSGGVHKCLGSCEALLRCVSGLLR